jgi:hypothetical protein
MPDTNGTCTSPDTPKPPKPGQQCGGGAYLCRGASCAEFCEDDTLCAPGYYCPDGQCRPKKKGGEACQVKSECESGSCQAVDAPSDADGGASVCCDRPCEGQCFACVTRLTGNSTLGTCGPVLSRDQHGPGDRCVTDPELSPCGHDGYCDGQGACSLWAQGTVVGGKTCVMNDAGEGVACLKQSCDGQGRVSCEQELCPYGCEENKGCKPPPDAGGEGDGASEASDDAGDVSVDAPSAEASVSDGGREAASPKCDNPARDGGCPCKNQLDCNAPWICRFNGTCGAGLPGERCWPASQELSHFNEQGQCVAGAPYPTEIVGRCSAGSRGRGAAGWQALVGVLGALWMRRSRRQRLPAGR